MNRTILTGIFACVCAAYGEPQILDGQRLVPDLEYGPAVSLPLPKTILFSAGPDEIAADAEAWAAAGISAFFMDFVARDWSSDIWAGDKEPWTIGPSDALFQQARKANEICKRIGSETFLKIAFDHPFEWFNDTAWDRIDSNFRQFAVFARDTGCTGLALDIEYAGKQYAFTWEGYDYDGYTRRDLVAKVRERMTGVMAILYDEFPDMVFLTFPEQGFNLGGVIHAAWLEEAARRNAPGGVHYCTERTYRNPNINYMFAWSWACNSLLQNILSEPARQYWTDRCSVSAGIWPFGFDFQNVHEPGMGIEEFRQGYAASLMMSPRYNWIYSHNSRSILLGRDLDKYQGTADLRAYLKIIADRRIVTTRKYIDLAHELRQNGLRNYSADLKFAPQISFAAPAEAPIMHLAPAEQAAEARTRWPLALEYFQGADLDLAERFGTIGNWLLIGPFPNPDDFEGHAAVYPPERSLDLVAEYPGVAGTVRWREYTAGKGKASVDLTRVFTPTEHVCAYALGFVSVDEERPIQIRIGANDACKVWLAGAQLFDWPAESTAYLDAHVIPVTLPKGKTPVLLKISNNQRDWGFVFRLTHMDGAVARDVVWSVHP